MDNLPSVIICGCAKDCSRYIDGVFKNIEMLKEIFEVRTICIAFDVSSDDTKSKLLKKKEHYNIILLEDDRPLINCTSDGKLRVINICNARNRYMKYLSDLKDKPEYFIVMDMDDVCSKKIDINPIKLVVNDSDNWDGITFDNPRYYDFWALSIKPFTVSCFISDDILNTMRIMLKNLQEKRKGDSLYIDCESSFNGFGIYKTRFFKCFYSPLHMKIIHDINDIYQCFNDYSIKYSNFFENNIIDCEHRAFNMIAKIKYGARLKICKQQIFDDYTGEHASWLYE